MDVLHETGFYSEFGAFSAAIRRVKFGGFRFGWARKPAKTVGILYTFEIDDLVRS